MYWRLVTNIGRTRRAMCPCGKDSPDTKFNAIGMYLGFDGNVAMAGLDFEVGSEHHLYISSNDWNSGSGNWDYADEFASWVQEVRAANGKG